MLTFGEIRTTIVDGVGDFAARLDALGAEDWERWTRCPGWKVRDVAWHVAWGEGPGEVIRAAREGLPPPDFATNRMGPTPTGTDEIVRSMHDQLAKSAQDLGALTEADADMVVRYGSHELSLVNFLWGRVVEVVVHGDDLVCALDRDEPVDPGVAGEIVVRRVREAVRSASDDGLQPAAPRGYRLTGDGIDCGFFYRDGAWQEGIDEDVPTCTFTSDNTTLMRLVAGRIAVSPFAPGRFDDRLGLSGEVLGSLPFDFMRWCYGFW